ncbi:MAG: hypothetical protein AB7O59_22595 [Pirellulales bacterium]
MSTAPLEFDVTPPPRPVVRALVSGLVIVHVVGVFLGPFAMPPQTSQLAATVANFYRPYVDTLYLANGYRFFAPEPGPSHLVRYQLTFDDGTSREGVFPNKAEHKPRLLYHRHFMMSEFLNTLSNPDAPRDRLDGYVQSYAEHLLHETGAKEVKLSLVRHWVPRMDEVRAGRQLSDHELYEERPLGTFQRDPS